MRNANAGLESYAVERFFTPEMKEACRPAVLLCNSTPGTRGEYLENVTWEGPWDTIIITDVTAFLGAYVNRLHE